MTAAAIPSARELLARHGLVAKKSWGQSFLVDQAAQARIVAAAAIEPDDSVVEIGAGLGALTTRLVEIAGHVLAVERDPELARILEQILAGRRGVEIAVVDALELDFAAAATRGKASRPLVVVGNLPYRVTSPLLFAILKAAARGRVIGRAVLMVQREVATRLTAAPWGKDYGRLSVMVQQQAEIETLFHVGSRAFFPRPQVTSTVFRLIPRRTWLAPVRDETLFEVAVRAAFSHRRKMLRGVLAPAFGERVAAQALACAGIDGTVRAETLTVADFARLTDALSQGREHA